MSVSRETVLSNVSRETGERLEWFAALLETWNARINLVGRREIADLWGRHIADSMQLQRFLPSQTEDAVDLGSGAGFPGLVLAICTNRPFTLVEADVRKATFLREAARVANAPVTVVQARIEDACHLRADLVTARALAPLTKLLDLAYPLLLPDATLLFLKGVSVEAEIDEAHRTWTMRVERHISHTSGGGVILRISEVARA